MTLAYEEDPGAILNQVHLSIYDSVIITYIMKPGIKNSKAAATIRRTCVNT